MPVDEELTRMADIALRIAKADLERDGGVTPVIVYRQADGAIKQLPFPEECGGLMNHGEAKDIIFAIIREMTRANGWTAVIFATEAWMGRATAKGLALPKEEFTKRTREKAFEGAVRDGLVERSEAVIVNVQTADACLMVTQIFERDERARRIHYGHREQRQLPQAQFAGRQKMFGDLRPENLG